MANSISDFLRTRVHLFETISEDNLEKLVKGSQVVTYETNEAVALIGQRAGFLGVVLEGNLNASIVTDGKRHIIRVLHEADTLGETSLMSGDKIRVDYFAASHTRFLKIPVALFQTIILPDAHAIQVLSKTLVERLQEILQDPNKRNATFHEDEDPYEMKLKGDRPEKILILNCGSSSIKYSFFDSENEDNTVRGQVERIGMPGTRLIHNGSAGQTIRSLEGKGYEEGFAEIVRELTNPANGIIKNVADISVVGHRVVHGGELFSEAVIVTDEIILKLEKLNPLAPLHNPVNIAGIKSAQLIFSAVPHVAVFDTAFHATLPSYAYLYGLPYEFYEKYSVRRYGFHGSSHSYVALKASQYLKQHVNELTITSCHLGNGASLCAIDHGRSVDTTMGFTPGEGLIMGTRCGDVDPGVITYLEREHGLTGSQIDNILNKQSGLLGLSELSGDMREVEKAAEEGNIKALIALKAFCYRIRKYIGAYLASMGGMDVLIFTGGIGQGSAGVRSLALQGLKCMGIYLDEQRNRDADGFKEICCISTDDSPVTVLVIPTDEEHMIARETLRTISRSYLKDIIKNQKNEPFLLEVSAHHIHLSQEHVEALFGVGHQLTKQSDLSQPGQFACVEQLSIVGPKGNINRVRVLGPARKATQVEIAMTEQFKLGIHPPLRESGDIQGSPGCILEGTNGQIKIEQGVICALRHIHMTPADALHYGVKDKAIVRVRVAGERELIFGDVLIRVHPDYKLAMHIDTDEANAANLKTGDLVYIESLQG